MLNLSEDRKRLDSQRSAAARYFAEKYDRETRYLIVMQRDFENYLKSSQYLLERHTEHQFYWDFLGDFERLKELMKEFRWSKEFLKENGIDFLAVRKLYFAVTE